MQGCRCDGFVQQQSRAQGIAAGGLAAGALLVPVTYRRVVLITVTAACAPRQRSFALAVHVCLAQDLVMLA